MAKKVAKKKTEPKKEVGKPTNLGIAPVAESAILASAQGYIEDGGEVLSDESELFDGLESMNDEQ